MSDKEWKIATSIAGFVTITLPIGLPILWFAKKCRSAVKNNIPEVLNSPEQATDNIMQYCNADNNMFVNIATYSANFIQQNPHLWLGTFLLVAIVSYLILIYLKDK